MHLSIELNPLAYQREAERLRHMAHRATRCRDLAPSGFNPEQWAKRLERQAAGIVKGH